MRTYFEINVVLAFAFALFWSVRRLSAGAAGFSGLSAAGLSARFWLRLAQGVLAAAVVLTVAATLIPKRDLFQPMSRVWERSERLTRALVPALDASAPPTRAAHDVNAPAPAPWPIAPGALALLLVLSSLSTAVFARRLLALRRELARLPVARALGNVRVVVSDRAPVPFSAWLGKAYVVLPAALLADREGLRHSLQHELQHHRQRDFAWVYGLAALRACCLINPAAHAWSRLIGELQEYACDEFLIRIRGVSLQAYGRCLIEAAQTARESRGPLAGTTSMAAGFSGAKLKRRIEMMFEYRKASSMKHGIAALVALGTLALVGGAAYAQHSAAATDTGGAHPPLSYKQAEELAAKANTNPKFPVEMNELVLSRLNEWLTSDEKRVMLKGALERMQPYQAMIQQKITAFELADELLAVPIVESCYRNFNDPKFRSAGLWGFIVSTARRYGLHVDRPNDPTGDERLVEHRETLAAMRYYTHLRHIMYRDWRLAMRAYNEGESHVQDLIDEYGTKDPWALERAEPSKEDYLPKVIAAIIIMRNPSILD